MLRAQGVLESLFSSATVLVVDASRSLREILGQILTTHFGKIQTASSYQDAVRQLDENAGIDLVICAAALPDGDGVQLLERLAAESPSKPDVILIGSEASEALRARAEAAGAIGYLDLPISVRDIRASLSSLFTPPRRESRRRIAAKARVVEGERREGLLCFEIRDISISGALLETEGRLEVGTALELEILPADSDGAIRVRGTVVRVQEPSWLDVGGAAVRFDWVERPSELAHLVCGDDSEPPCD